MVFTAVRCDAIHATTGSVPYVVASCPTVGAVPSKQRRRLLIAHFRQFWGV